MVVLETDMEDLPEDVQDVLRSALDYGSHPRWLDSVPGLLCIVSSVHEGNGSPYSWNWWSRTHGYVNGELDVAERLARFEREFLPFVLDLERTCAVRVRVVSDLSQRWTWWSGDTVEDLHLRMAASMVMEV